MSTQIQPASLNMASTSSTGPWWPVIISADRGREVVRFVAYPDGRYFAEDSAGGKWFGEGAGRCKLWPWLVTE